MCGVVGEVSWRGETSQDYLDSMVESVSHRGPDGIGTWLDVHASLGHSRLAILDLSDRAGQPMTSACGRFVVAFNGEIYNFREIRKRLEAIGHLFRTTSDTEVLVEAWSAWGEDCVTELNGMFAFGIWDKHERQMYLVRDRYGIKPLYFWTHPGGVVFASEQRALRRYPSFRPTLNYDGLIEYLTFQNFFSNQTLTSGVEILSAGSILRIDLVKKRISTTRYWDFNFESEELHASAQEYEEELSRLLEQAVRRQLVSDVEVGSYLSGGMDSGSISAIASRSLKNLKTFTCGFDLSSISGLEVAFDERESAEQMSAVFGTEHYEVVLKSGDMQRSLPAVVNSLEEPRVGQSYPNFFAASLASRFVRVVLAGTGGDEIFAGYPWRYFVSPGITSRQQFVEGYFSSWQRLLSQEELSKVCKPLKSLADLERGPLIFDQVLGGQGWRGCSAIDQVNQCLYLEAKTFLHGLLIVEDKLSMYHGLESRLPFLDNDLVDFAVKCPAELKLDMSALPVVSDENIPRRKADQPISQRSDGKIVLRNAMRRHLPSSVLSRPKQGFSGPDASWFRGASIGFVRDRLLSDTSQLAQVLDSRAVHEVVEEHLSGRRNRRLLVWSLLCLDESFRSGQFS